MKYNALDFLACPLCKHSPLKLYEAKLKRDLRNLQKYYNCEQYCGYFEEAMAKARPSTSDCQRCYSRTIEQGILFCEQCGSLYQIKDGIPKLITDELKSEEEIQFLEEVGSRLGKKSPRVDNRLVDSLVLEGKKAEMRVRGRHEKDEIIARLMSERHQFWKGVEFEAVLQYLDIKDADIILDDGAAYGIFSLPFSKKCSYLISTDITFELLKAFRDFGFECSTKFFNGYERFPEEKVCLIQADGCRLPFREGFLFNKVISTQVVSHIPGEKEREGFLKEVWNYLIPEGTFVVTVGNWNLILRLASLVGRGSREKLSGASGEVGYYYKYKVNEFQDLLGSGFIVDDLRGLHSPLKYSPIFSETVASFLERCLQSSRHISCLTGDLLIAKCCKRKGQQDEQGVRK